MAQPALVRIGSLLVAVALASTGCGGGSGGATGSPGPSSPGGPPVPSDPFVIVNHDDLQLSALGHAVAARVGRPLAFDVDASLLKDHATHLHEFVGEALGSVARGVDLARSENRDVTTRACAKISALRIELDERARDPYAFVDAKTGVLVLRAPSSATAWASERGIANALLAFAE